jgi:cell division protein FtsA
MNSIENNSNSAYKIELKEVVAEIPKPIVQQPVFEPKEEVIKEDVVEEKTKAETTEDKIRRSFFDRYVDKIKDFLDNAE